MCPRSHCGGGRSSPHTQALISPYVPEDFAGGPGPAPQGRSRAPYTSGPWTGHGPQAFPGALPTAPQSCLSSLTHPPSLPVPLP